MPGCKFPTWLFVLPYTGILSYGSCGFTNNDGSLPLARDAVAAAADASADYAGSCGRCYAVRCRNGVVLGEVLPVPAISVLLLLAGAAAGVRQQKVIVGSPESSCTASH
jgi:hypothetical protein